MNENKWKLSLYHLSIKINYSYIKINLCLIIKYLKSLHIVKKLMLHNHFKIKMSYYCHTKSQDNSS